MLSDDDYLTGETKRNINIELSDPNFIACYANFSRMARNISDEEKKMKKKERCNVFVDEQEFEESTFFEIQY